MGAITLAAAPAWFVPAPSAGGVNLAQMPAQVPATEEQIVVIGRARAPIQSDPLPRHPLSLLRQYEAGASWGSSHPAEFCCSSQYETGMDGQAGR